MHAATDCPLSAVEERDLALAKLALAERRIAELEEALQAATGTQGRESGVWNWGSGRETPLTSPATSREGSCRAGMHFSASGPDLTTFKEHDEKQMRLEDAEKQTGEMKRSGSIGSSMWNWMNREPRESSEHGGNIFGTLWDWAAGKGPVSAMPSREPSLRGGNNFRSSSPDGSTFRERGPASLKAEVDLAQMRERGTLLEWKLWDWKASRPDSPTGSMSGRSPYGMRSSPSNLNRGPHKLRSPPSSRGNSVHGGDKFLLKVAIPEGKAADETK